MKYSEFTDTIKKESEAKSGLDFFEEEAKTFTDFENVKKKIAYKLVNPQRNKALLQDIPHKKYLDLAIVYYCLVSDKKGRTAAALIHNNIMKMWGVDMEGLHAAAVTNTPVLLPALIRPIDEVLDKMFNEKKPGWDSCERESFDFLTEREEGDGACMNMYVMTNTRGINGAACLLYRNVLAGFGQKIKRDLFLLPSSVHEIILVPKSDILNKEELSKMVREINKTEVSPKEILSDRVYEYDHLSDKLMM